MSDKAVYTKNVGYVDQGVRVTLGAGVILWQMIAPLTRGHRY
jgi:hypothetical protein